MRCRVGELIGPGHVAAGEDVGVDGLQVLVNLDYALRGNAQLLDRKSTRLNSSHT